ncbi:Zn-dependent hydrolase, glyoxylase [Halovivax ruber XH-70]|uniref:Zn-dependent hydrolase, glyoxylase n=1 Tax=Halovivax ruber (strain DSM 18193 / JCM 13892 / XH-70) TaxID=797302 RepID=L0IBH5_HALRX|nr:MBL fold metallo-hydrolase [Halovivax ruber]AGB16173.1 Zn-dependent hydrolase, glyoxylase [Halovivax ruber XH-70]
MNLESISLGNHEFEGKNNAYLLESAGETVLIDTGIHRPDIRDQLESGLAEHGRSVADIDAVLLTHHHIDHAALAGPIADESGATIYVHADAAPMVARDPDAHAAYDELQERRFEEWGMPVSKREELRSFFDAVPPIDGPDEMTTIADGDEIQVGDVSLTVTHAPGHSAGHCTFAFEHNGDREAFVGDVLLPVYTPNVGGADLRLENPLAHYVESITAIIDADYDRVWPGHRDVIEDPADRARTILEHHHERTDNVLEALRSEGPATAWEVSATLFGSLEAIHILHGPGEAFAHLDHLERAGVVDRSDGEYRLLDEDVAAADVLPAY